MAGSLFGQPGCNCCTGTCCFSVYVSACSHPLPGVSITLTDNATSTVVMNGTTNAAGIVVDGGGVKIRVCPGVDATYTLTWSYISGNQDRMQPNPTSISFAGSHGCPGGDSVATIIFTPIA